MASPNPSRLEYDLHLKIILCGDSGVGKSCILGSFVGKEFTGNYANTVGVDFEMKEVAVDGKKINLQIWDTAGQERYRAITTSYYRSCDAILVVYDITNKSTFSNVEAWLEDLRYYATKGVNIILVGNKVDLYEKRQVSYDAGKSYAASYGIPYMETSAKNHHGIVEAFEAAAKLAYKRLNDKADEKKDDSSVDFKDMKSSKKSCCF